MEVEKKPQCRVGRSDTAFANVRECDPEFVTRGVTVFRLAIHQLQDNVAERMRTFRIDHVRMQRRGLHPKQILSPKMGLSHGKRYRRETYGTLAHSHVSGRVSARYR